jgi:hypothetical protein
MEQSRVVESIRLQEKILNRLDELAYADREQSSRLSRQIAEIVTFGRIIAESTLPLFLGMPRERISALAKVGIALKLQMEELGDALNDIRGDLADFEEFFARASTSE